MGTSAGAGEPPAGQRPAPYLPVPAGAWPVGTDPDRVAMAGHSMGGAAAIAAMLADARIRAGIDMDGATCAPIPDDG